MPLRHPHHALPLLAAALWACGPKEEPQPDPEGDGMQLVADGLPSTLLSIWGTAADDIYMVGADDGQGPMVQRFDGDGWQRLSTGTTGDLWWVWGDGAQIWMTGAGARVLRHDPVGGSFVEEVVADPIFTLFGVWGSGPDDVYVVASDVSGGRPGEILHFDGEGWQSVAVVPDSANGSQRQPFKVWGTGPDDVWVVGTGALVMHFDGEQWTDLPPPVAATTTLFTVHGTGPDDVFAVGGFGNATVARFDGEAWSDDSPPPADIAPGFTGVFAHPEHGVAAAGNQGAIWWRGDDGWAPDPRTPATTWSFHAAWIDPDGGVWAAGGDLIQLDVGVVVYAGDRSIPTAGGR